MNWPCPYGFSDYVCFGHSGSPWSGASLAARRRNSVLRRTPLARILTLFRSPTLRQIIPPVAKLPAREKYRLPFALNFKHVCFGSLADIVTSPRYVRFISNNGRWTEHLLGCEYTL